MFADQARLNDSAEDVVDDVIRDLVPWGQAVKAVPGDGVSLILDDGKVLVLVGSAGTPLLECVGDLGSLRVVCSRGV